jgi:homoserine dehydrogenase
VTKPLKVAVAGLGTVGAGVLKLLRRNAGHLAARCGREIVVTAVSARDRNRDRGLDLSGIEWFDDAAAMASRADAGVVVELIGGSDGVAHDLVRESFRVGRHVITANKALLAEHGAPLAAAAEEAGVALAYEAAVAGGIPIVKALREGLAANEVNSLYGILNGTSNYILTEMRESRRDFADVLADAQAAGYAEADPSFDVDGVDAAHKLAILTSLAFGTKTDFGSVLVEGIRNISLQDIDFAEELGYRIKLLAIARRTPHGIEQRVHPTMVNREAAIARVEGVTNAVMVDAVPVSATVYQGAGAGEGPTASAVVADILDIAAGRRLPTFGVPAAQLVDLTPADMDQHAGAYYVRLTVRDQPGVIADVSAALRDENVSLESMLQRGRSPDAAVPVVLTTHDTVEAAMKKALARIASLDTVLEPPCMIRIEE